MFGKHHTASTAKQEVSQHKKTKQGKVPRGVFGKHLENCERFAVLLGPLVSRSILSIAAIAYSANFHHFKLNLLDFSMYFSTC